jgi:hypothetical protein
MQCSKCGSENEAGAKFCASCGAQLAAAPAPSPAPAAGVCPSCGKPVDPADKFCAHCGSPVAQRDVGIPAQRLEVRSGKGCPRCGTQNPSGTRFCGNCGASLEAGSGSTPAPSAAIAPGGVSAALAAALRSRDDARKRSAPESVIAAAEAEVATLRAQVRVRQGEIASELEVLRRELGAQEVRYKTGEYTEAQYRNATADVRRRIASLERLEESFAALLTAETESDLRRTSKQSPVGLGVATPSKVRESARQEVASAVGRVPGGKGAGRIPAPKWMLVGSGVLIAAGVVAVVILLLQTLGVTAGVPALPNPFSSDGGGAGTPASPPASVAPMATTAPAGTQFQIPVQLRAAEDVGSLYLELDYDPAVVEILSFDFAALPASALSDHELRQGSVSIGIVTSGGLTGDWVVAFITCRKAAGAPSSGDTTITVSVLEAHSAVDLSEVLADGSDGHVNLTSLAVSAPTITCG